MMTKKSTAATTHKKTSKTGIVVGKSVQFADGTTLKLHKLPDGAKVSI